MMEEKIKTIPEAELEQVAGGEENRMKVYRCTRESCSLHRSWRSANITGVAPTCWKCDAPNEWKYADEV